MGAANYKDHLFRKNDENVSQYLTFVLAGEVYGVDIMKVKEIRKWSGATAIPNTPDYVLGVINLHGMIVPIVDLRKRFQLTKASLNSSVIVTVNITYEAGKRVVGLVVDAVSEVYNISEDDIEVTPDLGSVISQNYIRGLATVEKDMIIVLDIDLLINIGVLQDTVEKSMIQEDE